ncbi:MAG: hypothetical protein P8N52_00670 [Crocinitomicaceae bacterium]|nr:hypothetical protein [Crocinitomicaceae bacterium]MDG1777099.1 hypothetical protein [Crocinitomicaceae bacterium]
MRLLSLIAVFLLYSMSVFTQSINVSIRDINNNPIAAVDILNKDKEIVGESNEFGQFVVDKNENTIIGLSKRGFADRWLKLASFNGSEITITMTYYYQELNAVDVVMEKPENALDIDAVNIIDYFPFESSILTLKNRRNKYYIGVDSIGLEGPKYRFDIDRPKRLFIDCLGNMHVVCSEKVYQIAISKDTLIIVDQISKDYFNLLLKPCVAKFGDDYVLKRLTSNNQAYSLTLYDKYEDPKTFYYYIDEVSARVSAVEAIKMEFSIREQFYNDSLSAHALDLRAYLRQTQNGENPDINLDFLKKSITGRGGNTRWTERYALFANLTYPVNVRSFQVGDNVAVINYEIDSLSLYNTQGQRHTHLPFAVASDIKEVWQDLSNDNLYFYTRKSGNHLLYHLDDLTGKTTFLKSMREIGASKRHRVYKGYLYYLEIDNGFYRIKRSRLPNH